MIKLAPLFIILRLCHWCTIDVYGRSPVDKKAREVGQISIIYTFVCQKNTFFFYLTFTSRLFLMYPFKLFLQLVVAPCYFELMMITAMLYFRGNFYKFFNGFYTSHRKLFHMLADITQNTFKHI